MDDQEGPSKKDIEKQNSRDVVSNAAKEAGKKAMGAYGVPPVLSNMVANKIGNSPLVKNTLNKIADNPLLRKGLSSAKPALDMAKPNLNSKNDNPLNNKQNSLAPGSKPEAKPNDSKEPAKDEEKKEDKKDPFVNPLKDGFNGLPLKVKLYIYGGLAGFILFIIIMTSVASMVLNPIQPLLDLFSGKGGDGVTNVAQQNFVVKMEEREKYWLDKNVEVDTSFAVSLAFANKSSVISDYACEGVDDPSNCHQTDSINYDAMTTEVIDLMDNMVKSKTIYYCQDKVAGKTEGDVGAYSARKECGIDAASCATVCAKDAKITSDATYAAKTNIEYNEWLITNYIPTKAVALEYSIPSTETEKETLYQTIITEAGERKDAVSIGSPTVDSSTGEAIVGVSIAGEVPEAVLAVIGNPFGTDTGIQTSCFRYYGINNSNCHGGIDMVTKNQNQPLYSIADGVVTNVVRNGINGQPDWNASNYDPPKSLCNFNVVFANRVDIKHKLMIDGVETVWISVYIHLDTVEKDVKLGATVTKGQEIGMMGNTGCSTAVHLHFQLFDGKNKNYNTENLFAYFGSRMIASCSAARIKWSSVSCR